MNRIVTLFSTQWCGHCRRLKRGLHEAGIDYVEVDVDQHAEFGDSIARATGGYRTVPSVEVAGRLLVNPSVAEVADAAETGPQTGWSVPFSVL